MSCDARPAETETPTQAGDRLFRALSIANAQATGRARWLIDAVDYLLKCEGEPDEAERRIKVRSAMRCLQRDLEQARAQVAAAEAADRAVSAWCMARHP